MTESLMRTSEPAVHLEKGERFRCDVVISQDQLDAIHALVHWLDGYTAGTGQGVPGKQELVEVFRAVSNCHRSKHR